METVILCVDPHWLFATCFKNVMCYTRDIKEVFFCFCTSVVVWMTNVPYGLQYLIIYSQLVAAFGSLDGTALGRSVFLRAGFEPHTLSVSCFWFKTWPLSFLPCSHACHLLLCLPTMMESLLSGTISPNKLSSLNCFFVYSILLQQQKSD